MSDQRFNVILLGTTLHGLPVAEVAPALAKLIHRDVEFATSLLQGKPVKVKSGVDSTIGGHYLEVLESINVAAFLDSERQDEDAGTPPPSRDAAGTEPQAAPAPASATDATPPPDATPTSLAEAAPPPTEELYRAVLGKNADAYLTFFRRENAAGGRRLPSWHWPAFLTGGAWALYRRMYGWFLLCFSVAVIPVVLMLTHVVEAASAWPPTLVLIVVTWGSFAVYAQSLYHVQVRKLITRAQAGIADEARLLERLRLAGGVNTWWLPWVLFGSIVLAILVALSYQSYTKRASQLPSALGKISTRRLTGKELEGHLVGTWVCSPSGTRDAGSARTYTYMANGTTVSGALWVTGDDQLLYEQPTGPDADGTIVPIRIDWTADDWTRFNRTVVGTGHTESCVRHRP